MGYIINGCGRTLIDGDTNYTVMVFGDDKELINSTVVSNHECCSYNYTQTITRRYAKYTINVTAMNAVGAAPENNSLSFSIGE